MYTESITNIDEGDVIAFIDDLQFEYESPHEITEDEALTIDWMEVRYTQVTGSLIVVGVRHEQTDYVTSYNVADHTRVLVYED